MKNLGGSVVRLFSCKVSELKWFWKCVLCQVRRISLKLSSVLSKGVRGLSFYLNERIYFRLANTMTVLPF